MLQKEKQILFKKDYDELSKPVYRFLYFKTGDKEMSEDLVHEVFIKYWKVMDTEKILNVKNYLFTIARNLMINEARHNKVVLKFQQQLSSKDTFNSPQFDLEMSEFKEKLEGAIADLPEGQREVFLMSRVEELKYKEIAVLLEVSQKAVEKRMSKALNELRKIYSKI
jgi:RNA polymerase sigma-70 factor (ECF subfamily)